MFEDADHGRAYELWLQHNNMQQTNTELVVLDFLRTTYPNHHVTVSNPSKCDLLGFAAAGLATATQKDNCLDHAVRTYKAPGYRLEKDAGKVEDDLRFGSWLYSWNDDDYLVYQAEYQDRWARDIKLLYVLHPFEPEKRHNAATDALLLEAGKWTRELHGEIYVFDNAEWKKSKGLWKSVQGASWEDVILDADMKAGLIADVQDFFDAQEVYRSMNVPWKRGVILHGVPGNGKTISIKALINSLDGREDPVPSLYVKSLDACAGPKWSIQEIFKKARTMAPCLLIFEDLDSMVTPKTRSYFLNEVDGLESNEGILMIGSTNHLDHLDPAITKRPSRFDRKYHFKLPDEKARSAYCQYWCNKFASSEKVDFPETICPLIAKMTPGFSFAYLQELYVASLLTLARGTYDDSDQDEVPQSGDDSSSSGWDAVTAEKEDKGETAEAVKGPTEEEKAAPPKAKMVMPQVEIPDTLQGNVLLRIVKKQASTLMEEMDNTDGVPAKKELACDDGGEPPIFSPAWLALRAR